MNKERDLLPWIFGGLSAAAIAVAFAAVTTHRDVPSLPPPVVAQLPASTAASPAPIPTTAPTAPPVAEPDPAPAPALPLAQTTEAPKIPGGQIWECTTQGVKTFSNNPCGEKSTQLDVGPVNTMKPSTPVHYVRAYGPEPRYPAGYDQSAPDDQYSDQYAAESGGNSYTIVQGVGFIARRRPEHFHPPPPSSHNPAHNSGHNSGPVRRY